MCEIVLKLNKKNTTWIFLKLMLILSTVSVICKSIFLKKVEIKRAYLAKIRDQWNFLMLG